MLKVPIILEVMVIYSHLIGMYTESPAVSSVRTEHVEMDKGINNLYPYRESIAKEGVTPSFALNLANFLVIEQTL